MGLGLIQLGFGLLVKVGVLVLLEVKILGLYKCVIVFKKGVDQ